MTPEVDDLKFDVERLETAVDVLAASVNAATIRAETAEAEVEQLRRQRDALRDEVAELRERAVDVIVSRGVDPKDPEGANAVSRGDKAPPSDENHHTRPQGHPDTPSRQEAP